MSNNEEVLVSLTECQDPLKNLQMLLHLMPSDATMQRQMTDQIALQENLQTSPFHPINALSIRWIYRL